MFDISHQILKAISKGDIAFMQFTEATKQPCFLNLPSKLHINARQVTGLWLHPFDLLTSGKPHCHATTSQFTQQSCFQKPSKINF